MLEGGRGACVYKVTILLFQRQSAGHMYKHLRYQNRNCNPRTVVGQLKIMYRNHS